MTFSSRLRHQKLLLFFVGFSILSVLLPRWVSACAVCFGTTEPDILHGLQAAILVLIVMVALVFAGIGGFLLAARHRIRRLGSGTATEVHR